MQVKKGSRIAVRTNTKGWVNADVLEDRGTTVLVKLCHDKSVIVRKKNRDLKPEYRYFGGKKDETETSKDNPRTKKGKNEQMARKKGKRKTRQK